MVDRAQFYSIFDMQGFDDSAAPPWQMVPVDGDRYVLLTDSAGLSLRSSNPSVAMWHEVSGREIPGSHSIMNGHRALRLHSGEKGWARIVAYERSKEVAHLDVETKFAKTLRITFNFVRDKAGEKTVHTPAEATQWVRRLNLIYQQANIRFVCRSARWVTLDADVGWVIHIFNPTSGSKKDREEETLLEAQRDPGADLNVFHFNDFRLGDGPEDTVAALGVIGGRCVYVDDDAALGEQYVNVLAHEIGHNLGLGERKEPNALMHPWMKDGVELNRDEVNKINP